MNILVVQACVSKRLTEAWPTILQGYSSVAVWATDEKRLPASALSDHAANTEAVDRLGLFPEIAIHIQATHQRKAVGSKHFSI